MTLIRFYTWLPTTTMLTRQISTPFLMTSCRHHFEPTLASMVSTINLHQDCSYTWCSRSVCSQTLKTGGRHDANIVIAHGHTHLVITTTCGAAASGHWNGCRLHITDVLPLVSMPGDCWKATTVTNLLPTWYHTKGLCDTKPWDLNELIEPQALNTVCVPPW